jgi:NTE family protein
VCVKKYNKQTYEILKINMEMTEFRYNYLVLSGGGVRGSALLGALEVLNEHKCLNDIHTYVGSSVGALIIMLLCIGYYPQEIFDIVSNVNIKEMQQIDIWKMISHYGLDTASKMMKYIKTLMRKKNINTNVTLKELYDITNKRLIITGTCIDTHTIEYFDDITAPNLKVIDAVRISISIPFVFTSPKYKDCHYVDGGLLDNYPIAAIQKYIKPGEKSIAITLNHFFENAGVKVNSFELFSIHLVCTMLDEIHRLRKELHNIKKQINKFDENIDLILIDTGTDFSSVQLDIDTIQIEKLFNLGRYQAARFLENKFENQFNDDHHNEEEHDEKRDLISFEIEKSENII